MESSYRSESGSKYPLRVALFSGAYNYISDGISLTLNRLVEDLERDGVDVMVFAPTAKTPAFEHSGTLVSVPSVPIPLRPEYRFALGIGSLARRRFAEFKPNLIHVAVPDFLGYQSLWLARRYRIPVVASYHTRYETYFSYYGMGLFRALAAGYIRHFYRKCDRVCAPSQSMADELEAADIGHHVRIWGRGVDTVRFNPNKRSLDWRRSLGIGDEEVVVVFVSRLVREKDLGTFVNVVRGLQRNGTRFRAVIVGDGPDRGYLEENLSHAIFTGFLVGEDLARAYASADIFLFPSVTETFGNVTLEAMASGLPVVCAKATGSSSLVDPEITGYLAQPQNVDQFVGFVESLISCPDLRRKMGAAGRARSRTYTRANAYSQMRSIYDDVLNIERAPDIPLS